MRNRLYNYLNNIYIKKKNEYFDDNAKIYWIIVRFSITFTLMILFEPFDHFLNIRENKGIFTLVFQKENNKFSFTSSEGHCFLVLIVIQTLISNLCVSLYENAKTLYRYFKILLVTKKVKIPRREYKYVFFNLINKIFWVIFFTLFIYFLYITFFMVINILVDEFILKNLKRR